MAETEIDIEQVFKKMMFGKNKSDCGYFPDRQAENILTYFDWPNSSLPLKKLDCIVYEQLLRQGFRRYSSMAYNTCCQNCHECIPIRICAKDFIPSKSQRRILHKNQDVEVTITSNPTDFCTEEKALIYRNYYKHHNEGTPGFQRLTLQEATEDLKKMNSGYSGVINLDYKINGQLIGVSILDYVFDQHGFITGLSSNYFYYDISQDVLKRSIGVYSVLVEINFCLKNHFPYYYLGLYLPHCRKMNYKINYKPYQLLLNRVWTDSPGLEQCPQVLENYLRVENEKSRSVKIDTSDIFTFPDSGLLYGHDEISLITENIPLRLLYSAYNQGVFPWFNEDQGEPVLWQSPKKRFVIPIRQLHVSKSIEKFLKHNPYTYTIDKAFADVIKNCAKQKRPDQIGTWIGPKMIKAYKKFHKAGFAHSIEVWKDGKLAGGFYGVLVGSVFCGESMFTIEPNSSKSAFVLFARAFEKAGGKLIDCQTYTQNMARYGAREITRKQYLTKLEKYSKLPLKCPIEELFD
ncbi:MAG: leucyl/phenylalanyl-tRNA--protein transferase [Treponema sp.]|nr:leucyl/phenylalanyl-tRNA--protein transferase [Treponema sp.]